MSGLGPILGYTSNLNLRLVNFDFIGWGTFERANWQIVDAVIATLTTTGNLQGLWQNAITVTVGQRYVDADDGSIWQVEVGHTTASSPTTFATDRANNPANWSEVNPLSVSYAGVWANDTTYTKNDFVSTTDHRYLICTVSHVSSSAPDTIDDDITNWEVLVDLSTSVSDAETAATVAQGHASDANDAADASEDWAIQPEDVPVPVASGGDGATTFSALHWAAKAAAVVGSTVAGAINAATGKATPHDNDEIGIVDTEDANSLKKLTWANAKATLQAYFDTLYSAITHNHDTSYNPIGAFTDVIVVAGTTYTLQASDLGALLLFTNSSAVTVTIDKNEFTAGDFVAMKQSGTGKVSVVAGTDVTLDYASTTFAAATLEQGAIIVTFSEDDTIDNEVFGLGGQLDFA